MEPDIQENILEIIIKILEHAILSIIIGFLMTVFVDVSSFILIK